MNTRVATLTFICLQPLGAQRQDLPADPERPTFQDCRTQSAQYSQILMELHAQNWSCIKQGVKFGYAPGCGREQYTAFVNCARFDVSICEIDERRKSSERTCQARAEARAQQEGQQKAEEERRALADRLKKANDTIEAARSLPSAISDPKTYFVKAFGANSPLLKELFKSSDYRSDSVKTDIASELYRFAQNYAKTGIQTTSNPLIRTIQQDALKRLGEQHKNILEQADALGASLDSFAKQSTAPAKPSGFTPGSIKVPAPSNAACAVFNDEDASRELMQRDGKRWLELYSQCAK